MTFSFAKTAVSALALGIAGLAVLPQTATAIAAGERDDAGDRARVQAGVQRAIAQGNSALAVQLAETAVAGSPRDAQLRVLLGDSYLAGGRFHSAAAAFADAVTLDTSLARAALSLTLAQVALGDQAAARDTLARFGATIPASDHGLALALAGDAEAGVAMLSDAVRSANATAKTRQNLALALALAGNWQDARVVVGQDLASDEADQRMIEWAALARPDAGATQVATLLGVTPAASDPGQPVQLALANDDSLQRMAAAPAPAEVAPAPARVADAQPVMPLVEAGAMIRTASVVFLPAREVVQALPAGYAPGGERMMMAGRRSGGRALPQAGGGNYVVQIGAYENSAIANAAWDRLSRRMGVLANYTPSSAPVPTGGWGQTRLAVGRFASEGAARQLCATLRGQGQRCFVRAVAGDVALRTGPSRERLAKL